MPLRFLPKDWGFFDLFEKQADAAIEAADLFKELVANGIFDDQSHKRMKAIEHQGDETTYALIAKLNKTFITPFDREDIYALAKELDDVIDMLDVIVNRMRVYHLGGINPDLVEFASLIDESVHAVACAVKGLRNSKDIKGLLGTCIAINELEDRGDLLRDKVIGDLFEKEKDPIAVIKWKEIYQDAETVLDICEDVANVVEAILVKQA